MRWKNVSSTEDYIARVTTGADPVTERRAMTRDERLEEALFTGLRLSRGIDIEAAGDRYSCDVWQRYGDALGPSSTRDGWFTRDHACA